MQMLGPNEQLHELPQIRRDFILEKCVSEMPRAFIAWCTGR
jgi:hypothetical protein